MTFAPRFDTPATFTRAVPRKNTDARIASPSAVNEPESVPIPIPAPTAGLSLFTDISKIPENGAVQLDNAFCEADFVRVRGGLESRNTGIASPIKDFFTYFAGINRRLFAMAQSATSSLYDVTSPGAVGAPLLTGLINCSWSYVQMATSGGVYLRVFGNGNTPLLYDGTTWATTPAITGFTATKASQGFTHGNRLFMIENDTTNAWYLAVDSIAGAAIKFPLGGLFSEGGSLVAGASWTSDSAQGGPTSACAFISSEGEIAIYQGQDPTTWQLQGVYRSSRPCGVNCFERAGGDLLVMTEDGLFAISQIVALDRAALASRSVSKNVKPIWNTAITSTDKTLWRLVRRDEKSMAILLIPRTSGQSAFQLVVNLQTGAWSRWTGWDASASVVFNNELIIGLSTGAVCRGDTNGSDLGIPYTYQYVGPFISRGAGQIIADMMRATVRSISKITPTLYANFNYKIEPVAIPNVFAVDKTLDAWGTAIWGQAIWGGDLTTYAEWQSVEGIGFAISPSIMLTIGQNTTPDIAFIQTDMLVKTGVPL